MRWTLQSTDLISKKERKVSRPDRCRTRNLWKDGMSARLASFRGPSTPSSSPVKQQAQSPTAKSTQAAAAKHAESTYHRKVRASLQELRAACHTWDDLVCKDGLRSVRELIDARTDLECVPSQFFILVVVLTYEMGPLTTSYFV